MIKPFRSEAAQTSRLRLWTMLLGRTGCCIYIVEYRMVEDNRQYPLEKQYAKHLLSSKELTRLPQEPPRWATWRLHQQSPSNCCFLHCSSSFQVQSSHYMLIQPVLADPPRHTPKPPSSTLIWCTDSLLPCNASVLQGVVKDRLNTEARHSDHKSLTLPQLPLYYWAWQSAMNLQA